MTEFKTIIRQRNREKYSKLINPIKESFIEDWNKKTKEDIKLSKGNYRKKVKQLTGLIDKHLIDGYNKDLVFNYKKHGCITKNHDKLVIDHKIPVIYGYKNNIDARVLSHISNLQFITVRENMIKGVIPLIDSKNEWIIKT